MSSRRPAAREAFVFVGDGARLVIVCPSREGDGVRHATVAGEERTLCGRRCEWWRTERGQFDAGAIGCRTCRLRAGEAAAPSAGA